jgi:hypothetical protein
MRLLDMEAFEPPHRLMPPVGLIPISAEPLPRGLNYTNDGLPAGVHVHVLDGNLLLPLPSIALQCLGLGREGSQKFHSEISVAVLLGYHVRPLQTAQRTSRSEMRRNHLDCQHRLDFVVRLDSMNRRECSVDVLLTWRMTGGAITGRIDKAIEQNARNASFRCPECQRQARAVGRLELADFQRLVRFRFQLKRGASGRLSRRLRYRSRTARCFGVDVASSASAERSASLRLRRSVFRVPGCSPLRRT